MLLVVVCVAMLLASPLAAADDDFRTASQENDRGNALLARHEYGPALAAYRAAAAHLPASLDIHKNILVTLLKLGDSPGVLAHADAASLVQRERTLLEEAEEGTGGARLRHPTVLALVGVALYNMNRLSDATAAFRSALLQTPADGLTWTNLGDTLLHQYRVQDAVVAHAEAHHLASSPSASAAAAASSARAMATVAALFRSKSWMCDWDGWNALEAQTQRAWSLQASRGGLDLGSYGDFVDVPARTVRAVNAAHARTAVAAAAAATATDDDNDDSDDGDSDASTRTRAGRVGPLRIGFLSSDFGVHPVSSLIRGLLAELSALGPRPAATAAEVFVYILTDQTSWWRTNITATVHHAVDLFGLSRDACRARVRRDSLDVLVDLNGWTMHSGTGILAGRRRLAPVQALFLGYSLTSGADFVDYYIADPVAVAAEHATADFSERMLFLPHSFFANDYAAVQAHVVWRGPGQGRPESLAAAGLGELLHLGESRSSSSSLSSLSSPPSPPSPPFVFACFVDFRKMDPVLFDVWMNLLRLQPGSVLWLLRHHKLDAAVRRLQAEAAARGVAPARIVATGKAPWIHHILSKSAGADVVLDTRLVGGHTSTADALWGGVPVLTVQGRRLGQRVAGSLVHGLLLEEEEEEEEEEAEEGTVGGGRGERRTAASAALAGMVTRSLRAYEDVGRQMPTRFGGGAVGRGRVDAAEPGDGVARHAGDPHGDYGPHAAASRLLRGLRREVRQARVVAPLFRMTEFAQDFYAQLRAAVAAAGDAPQGRRMHVVPDRSSPVRRRAVRRGRLPVALSQRMPADPFTDSYYDEEAKAEETGDNDGTDEDDASHGLVLLHVRGTLPAHVASPAGWRPVLGEVRETTAGGMVTAVYATLVDDVPGLARRAHHVLRKGGALFVTATGATAAVAVEGVLRTTGFCAVRRVASFGSFDVHRADDEELARISGRVCAKAGAAVDVRIQ